MIRRGHNRRKTFLKSQIHEIMKMFIPANPSFTISKVGFVGVKSACYRDVIRILDLIGNSDYCNSDKNILIDKNCHIQHTL